MSICNIFALCLIDVVRFTLPHIYPEVINDEGEADWAGIVRPQAWRGFALAVAILPEAFFKKLLGNDPGLW